MRGPLSLQLFEPFPCQDGIPDATAARRLLPAHQALLLKTLHDPRQWTCTPGVTPRHPPCARCGTACSRSAAVRCRWARRVTREAVLDQVDGEERREQSRDHRPGGYRVLPLSDGTSSLGARLASRDRRWLTRPPPPRPRSGGLAERGGGQPLQGGAHLLLVAHRY